MDELLDQEGLEVDPVNKLERATPLHKAVQFAKDEKKLGLEIVKMLVDAGADPRIRNKQKQKPIDIADPRDKELRDMLLKGEYMMTAGDDLVQEDDYVGTGSGSESD